MTTNAAMRLTGAAFTLCLVGSACASGSGVTAGPSSTSGPAPATTPSTTPSPRDRFATIEDGAGQFLDFDGPRVGGGRLAGLDHAGRDVVLWFFAPW